MIPHLNKALYILLGINFFLAACHKNDVVKGITKTTPDTVMQDTVHHDIYVAGVSNDTAVYWKNGLEVHLSDGTKEAMANSIFVTTNNDVYVAGTMYTEGLFSGPYKAAIWKNGAVSIIDNNPQSVFSEAYAITVSGSDVYVGGYTTNGPEFATYWKNGTPTVVGGANSSIYGLSINGNDLYTSGESFVGDSSYATYWKNGQATVLGPGTSTSLFVSNNNVYTAGYQDIRGADYGAYWKNQSVMNFSSTPGYDFAEYIFVSGNDVYVAGYHHGPTFTQQATYWKNGVAVTLNNGPSLNNGASWAQSIVVVGKDVYVVGAVVDETYSSSEATVWKNGVPTKIGGEESFGNAIFVK
jgi:hypothetical protein